MFAGSRPTRTRPAATSCAPAAGIDASMSQPPPSNIAQPIPVAAHRAGSRDAILVTRRDVKRSVRNSSTRTASVRSFASCGGERTESACTLNAAIRRAWTFETVQVLEVVGYNLLGHLVLRRGGYIRRRPDRRVLLISRSHHVQCQARSPARVRGANFRELLCGVAVHGA